MHNTRKIATEICQEALKATYQQTAALARHHTAKAQRAYDELWELVELNSHDTTSEADERRAAIALEDAWQYTCAVAAAEKKAEREGTTKEQRTGGKTPRDVKAFAAPFVKEARDLMAQIVAEDEAEDEEPTCPVCGGAMPCDQPWCMAKRATEDDDECQEK